MARDILAQGELFLQTQFQSAVASDQRATTMAGLLITVSTAIFAGVVTLWDKLTQDALNGGLVSAVTLLAAAFAAAWAARPIDFWYPGSRPEQWYHGRTQDSTKMIGGQAENVQMAIEENEAFMAGNQTAIRASFVLALVSPLLGLATWGLLD
jgi:hypothetical protein